MVAAGGGVKTSTGITRVLTGVLTEVGSAVGKATVASRFTAPEGVAELDCPQPAIEIINTKPQMDKVKILFRVNLLRSNEEQSILLGS